MSDRAADSSVLYELAQTMVGQEDYPTAIALRKLAQAGYATLEQVDGTSDWVLLATPGIGIHRLTAVRRLVRPDWQPPRLGVIKIAQRFLSAARLALRFWSIEELEAVIQDSVSLPTVERPVEKRLSLDQFLQATRKALRHCEPEELGQALRQARCDRCERLHPTLREYIHGAASRRRAGKNGHGNASVSRRPGQQARRRRAEADSQHYAFSADRRREIVARFRAAWRNGQVANKEHWARANYSISAKTLLRYEREFPEENTAL